MLAGGESLAKVTIFGIGLWPLINSGLARPHYLPFRVRAVGAGGLVADHQLSLLCRTLALSFLPLSRSEREFAR